MENNSILDHPYSAESENADVHHISMSRNVDAGSLIIFRSFGMFKNTGVPRGPVTIYIYIYILFFICIGRAGP